MVFDKCQYGSRVGVEEVVYEAIVHAIQTFEPCFGLLVLGSVDFIEEAEVHDGFQVTVLRGREFGIHLPPGCISRFGNPGFAYGVVVGVFFVQLFHPVAHGVIVGIRISVHADTVDIGILNPPEAILYQVAIYVRVLLIKVRHSGNKPTVVHLVEIVL